MANMPRYKIHGQRGQAMSDIRLIVTDLDWTYLNEGNQGRYISTRNVEAVQRARNIGVRVAACTARPWALCDELIRSLHFDEYAVTCNGAAIVETQTGREIEATVHRREWVRAIVNHVTALGYRVDIYCGAAIHSCDGLRTDVIARRLAMNKDPAQPHTNIRTFADRETWLKETENDTKIIRMQMPQPMPLPEEIRAFIEPMADFQVTCSLPGYWDIAAPDTNKFKAIEKICGWLGIQREQVMAIGDGVNDIGMIQWAGLGIAMGNANDVVKQAADYIADTYDQDGFAQAVYRYVLF